MADASASSTSEHVTVDIPAELNLAEVFLAAHVRAGRGDRVALRTATGARSYAQVWAAAQRFAGVLAGLGIDPEQRVIIALPDVPAFAETLFGTLANGSVVVMVNCHLKPDEIAYFYRYTRAKVAVVHADHLSTFTQAAEDARDLRHLLVLGDTEPGAATSAGRAEIRSLEGLMEQAPDKVEIYPTHRDDAAIWLFSGGTTGRPKAVVQTHASFYNTTHLYGHRVLGMNQDDVTLSVPKLYFGYATGSNLLFPFSVGASAILFPERCTPEALFEHIARHRPTVLINVPTMINKMVAHPAAADADLSCLRLATSAGEALPEELYQRWRERFGVELLDGLGTAEMWHVFVSNRPGRVKPGTLGQVVPGFELQVRDDDGNELPPGEVGWLWVKGRSRAVGYWHEMDKSAHAFRGPWYVSGDMIQKDEDGYVRYCGRGDDMLKVSGKWLAPGEVENCLLTHPAVAECAVVGVVDQDGLTKPHAYVVAGAGHAAGDELAAALIEHVRTRLEPYKAPRALFFLDAMPRTHLGKVDRGALRSGPS
ncbi:benzoate-CoA ligase family protein [Haliangium sp.]|uniref:benzoate-CoA ligase family protein n=1 Tax=Haliangium sp. TaxID=2663208 RepID=UPI003D103FF1